MSQSSPLTRAISPRTGDDGRKKNLTFFRLPENWGKGAVLALAILSGVLLYENFTLKKFISARSSQSQPEAARAYGDKSTHQEDPYRAKAVKNTIIKNAEGISTCYKIYLTKNPQVSSGKVKIDWQILESGHVKSAGVVASQLNDKDFHTCLTNVVSKIEFPAPPSQSYYVEHTFTFEREKPAIRK